MLEDIGAIVAAVDHVVTGAGEFEPEFASHADNLRPGFTPASSPA